ncbi:polyprenyl synthetase family protein [Streptomyces sp. NPDC018972]|uniref:polyprenyl synthetase family protein n=1 Tax=Streptomyces sp. NPDC018972 TaxID=3365060 RepID=UPI0037B52E2A
MGRTQTEGHDTAGPRLVEGPASARARPDGARPGARYDATRTARPPWDEDASAVDRDVAGAVGRVLDHVLADRVNRAHDLDPLFGDDVAGRVARFTRAGGKRTRSRFLWWTLRACGGEGAAPVAAALRIGAALELLQTCALVHDDVMDGSVLRRARPTVHVDVAAQYADAAPAGRAERLGGGTAVLTGDLALAWADDLLAEVPLEGGTARTVRRLWSDMRTEMVAGQYLDLHGQATGSRSLPRALRTARLKSALYSVERPIALGAALAGADDGTTAALCAAGRCVGTAFQLRDDLSDVFGDPRCTGKPAGGDVREGKPTCLVALAHGRAAAAGDRRALDVLERSLGQGALTEEGLEEVREVLVGTGARTAVEAMIDRLVAQGLRHVDGALLDPHGGERLRLLLASAAGEGPARDAHPRGTRPEPARAAGGREAGR